MKSLTLAEYRKKELGVKQADIAREAECQQSWISQVERGHLPEPWNRDRLLKAYKLQKRPELFERLIRNARVSRELAQTMEQSHPLLASAQSEVPADVISLAQRSMDETRRRLEEQQSGERSA